MLSFDRLSKTYADGTRALSAITLEVGRGEIVALLGGSGCGKTTLLRLIGGMAAANSGRVVFDGELIDARDLRLPNAPQPTAAPAAQASPPAPLGGMATPPSQPAASDPRAGNPRDTSTSALPSYIEEIERNAIQQALQEHRYNKTKTAAALGITFRALRYKLKKLGIE